MANEADPLAQFGLEAIDLRWTLRDVAARRSEMINKAHLAKLIELDLVAMRGDAPYLTVAGQCSVGRCLKGFGLRSSPFRLPMGSTNCVGAA